jgi:hypothetical protein
MPKGFSRPFPPFTLQETLVVAAAIQERNAGKPMNRLLLADAIGRKAGSSDYRDLLSASFKYGLTLGTEKANEITLTPRGVRITKPVTPEERQGAIEEAALAPEVIGSIYRFYDNSKLPSGTFFQNVLERQFKIPRVYVAECEKLIVTNGRFAGLIRDISGSASILLHAGPPARTLQEVQERTPVGRGESSPKPSGPAAAVDKPTPSAPESLTSVFIAHGKNKRLLDQVKQVVEFGQLTPIVVDERETTAIPVPEKVIADMHQCQAAIIIVSADSIRKDENGMDRYPINENVLIEIGAATVLYRKKVVLLWDKRVGIPSNLQGLYRCEFEGDSLDWETGLKLQKVLTQFRTG